MNNTISLTQSSNWIFNIKQRLKVGICGVGVNFIFGRDIPSSQTIVMSNETMSPTIKADDYLIIDKSFSRKRGSLDFSDGLYYVKYVGVITKNGKGFKRDFVARLGRIPNKGLILFDNKLYDDMGINFNDVKILGKVSKVVSVKGRRDII